MLIFLITLTKLSAVSYSGVVYIIFSSFWIEIGFHRLEDKLGTFGKYRWSVSFTYFSKLIFSSHKIDASQNNRYQIFHNMRHHFTGLDNIGFIFALMKNLKYFLELIYMLIIYYNIYEEGTRILYIHYSYLQTIFWNLIAKILSVNINCPYSVSWINLFTLESYKPWVL